MPSLTWSLLALAANGTALPPSVTDSAPLDNITVEASKLPAKTTDLSARVTLIDSERMRRELAQDIADLVRYEPGVDVVDQGSRFGLSGISIRGIGGNRVKIEVDGVPTSDSFSIGSYSNASRDFVEVDSLKQVEIVRGPASATFGSDALGGVVSFVTRGPLDLIDDDGRYFDVSAGFNSVDTSNLLSGAAAFAAGPVATLLRVSSREGVERDVPGADPLDDDSLNLLARFDIGNYEEGVFSLTLERFVANSLTDVDSLERVQDFSAQFGFPYIIDTAKVAGDDRRERNRVSVGQEWAEGRFGTDYLRWRAYCQDSRTTQDTFEARESFIAGVASAVERDRGFRFDQELAGLEVNAANEFSTGEIAHQLAWGIEFESTDTEQLRTGTETDLGTGGTSNQVGPDLFPVRDFPMSTTKRMGVYLQDRIDFGAVSVIPGLRWDRHTLDPEIDPIFVDANPDVPVVDYDDEVSPKLGLLWDMADRWQLYAQYAEGFRAPPVNDVNVGFTNLQFGYTTLPNPELRSESSKGYEVGLRHSGEILHLDLATFLTRYDDFIESFQSVGFDPVRQLVLFQSINVDEVEIRGAELSGTFLPPGLPDGWQVNFAVAWAEGEDKQSGAPLNSVAPLNGVLGLDYTAASERWGGSFVVRGATRQDELDESAGGLLSPAGYVIYDAYGYWKPTETTRLRAGVYNLSDHQHSAYLDVQGVPADSLNADRYQRPGREFNVAFDWSF